MKPRDRVAHLERERRRLERLLALSLRVATAGTDVQPLTLLAVLEEFDREAQHTEVEGPFLEEAA